MKLWIIVNKETNCGNKNYPAIFETKEEAEQYIEEMYGDYANMVKAEGFVRVIDKTGEIYNVIGFDKTKIGFDKIITDKKED